MNSTGSPTRLSPASPMEAGTVSQPAPGMDTQKATPAADKALHSRMVQRPLWDMQPVLASSV